MNIDVATPDKEPKVIQMMDIILPYPPMELFPNNKRGQHHMETSRHSRKYRSDCFYVALEQTGPAPILPRGDFPVHVTFVWDGARPDSDNAIAAAKAAMDGLADALKVDDGSFEPLVISRAHIDSTQHLCPCIVVRVPAQRSVPKRGAAPPSAEAACPPST